MVLQDIITKQFELANLSSTSTETYDSDITEYMLLDSVNKLPSLQGKPLTCRLLVDGKQVLLYFGLSNIVFNSGKPSISPEELNKFIQLVDLKEEFKNSITDPTFLHPKYKYNPGKKLYAIVLETEDVINAIKSSSLFIALSDLSHFNLTSLILLRKKLNYYRIADDNLTEIVNRIAEKVNTQIFQKLQEIHFLSIEKKFNLLLKNLDLKLQELIEKGSPVDKTSSEKKISFNKKYNPNYSDVAPVAKALRESLTQASHDFFNNILSVKNFETFKETYLNVIDSSENASHSLGLIFQKNFEEFKQTCTDAIQNSKAEFAKFRGWAKWYNELNPRLKSILLCIKAIGGIVAGITIIPAVLTEIYTKPGYLKTFFGNEKTDSQKKLENFEQGLFAKNRIFDSLEKDLYIKKENFTFNKKP